jgi:hypothetical protein
LLSQCWEEGLTCRACGLPIPLAGDMLYGKHLECARGAAQGRRTAAGEAEDVVEVARQRLANGGRVILTSRQLRGLVDLMGEEPVRRPDKVRGTDGWYSRMAGWSKDRVESGLSAAEAAGLWLDHLDVGRQPPLRHSDLLRVLEAIDSAASCKPR